MVRPSILLPLSLLIVLVVALPSHADPCNEYFQVNSGPSGSWLGLHPDGTDYGAGQSFTLNCGSRLETVAFHIYWGIDYGEVPSLGFGDVVHLSILELDGTEVARKNYTIDVWEGNRTVTFYFHDDEVLLPIGTYIAALWTSVPACGGIKGYVADVVDGSCYRSNSASDFTSWYAHASESVHTIVVDSEVTPAEAASWSMIKTSYR